MCPTLIQVGLSGRYLTKMITLVDITPEINWDLPCNDTEYCDAYGCEIHAYYMGGACGVNGCDSKVSSYHVLFNGTEIDMCHYHYNTEREYN